MSRRPAILAGCLRLLACGPETTRDLSLHVGAPRALVAVALHGEPGVTREGDVWTLGVAQVEKVKAERLPPPRSHGGDCRPIAYMREHPGWHRYADLAEACEVSYSAVVVTVKRYHDDLKFSNDAGNRVLVAWKGAAVKA